MFLKLILDKIISLAKCQKMSRLTRKSDRDARYYMKNLEKENSNSKKGRKYQN